MDFKRLYADCPKNSILFNTEKPILRQLFASFDDTIFAWTPKGLTAAVNVRLNGPDTISTKISTLLLNKRPLTPVLHLELNKSGSRLALVCSNALYIVQIPLIFYNRTSREVLDSEYLCSCKKLDSVLPENDVSRILRVRWHPCSPSYKHLLTLCTDNVIRIYNVDTGDAPVQSVILSNVDSFAVVSPRAQSLRFSIGESAVSFDFGPPVNLSTVSKQNFYPIFVLYGNGDVYSVLIDVHHSRQFSVNGPLTITPSAEDNYGVDYCDLTLLTSGNGPHSVTVLAIATTYGNLYHCVVIQDEYFPSKDNSFGVSFVLHVYESIELEFSLSTVDLITKETKEDVSETQIDLYKDPLIPYRFYCAHGAGLHAVTLNWMKDLEKINANLDAPEDQYIGFDRPAVVDYYLCTCPQKSDQLTSPILGLTTLTSPRSLDSFLLVLLNDFSMEVIPLRIYIGAENFTFGDSQVSSSAKQSSSGKREYFIDHVKTSLQHNTTLPLLKAQNKQVSDVESVELFHRSVDVIKNEYIKKLQTVHRLCLESCDQLTVLKRKQEKEIELLSEKSNSVQQRQQKTTLKMDVLKGNQQKLKSRLDFVISSFAEKQNSISKAEEEMLKDLQKLQFRAELISEQLKKIEASARNSNKKISIANRPIDEMSRNAIQSRLEEQSQQIETLTKITKNILQYLG